MVTSLLSEPGALGFLSRGFSVLLDETTSDCPTGMGSLTLNIWERALMNQVLHIH